MDVTGNMDVQVVGTSQAMSSDITISNKNKEEKGFHREYWCPRGQGCQNRKEDQRKQGCNTDQRFHKEQGCQRGERYATRTRMSQGETYVTGCGMSCGLGLKQEQKYHREQAVHKERGCS